MFKIINILLLVCIFFISSAKSYGAKITIATCNWEPYQGEKLPKNGGVVELVRQALKRKGHSMTIYFMPWARAVALVKKGEYMALLSVWKNKTNDTDYYFSNETLGDAGGHLLALSSSKLSNVGLEDLRGKKIGYVRGYHISKKLKEQIKLGKILGSEVTELSQIIKLLESGRIDIILENNLVAKHKFKHIFKGRKYNIKIIGKDFIDGSLYVGWSTQKLNAEKFRDQLDNSLREMKEDGTYSKILKEHGL